MTTRTIQVLIAALICLGSMSLVYGLARTQRLSFRYAAGWLLFFGIGLFAGILLPLASQFSHHLGLSPAAFLALGGMCVFLAIAIQISISISGLQEHIQLLAERLARVQVELEEIGQDKC